MLYGISEKYTDDIITYRLQYSPWFDLGPMLSFHAKSTNVRFTFALVIVNSKIFDYSRFLTSWNLILKINWYEVLVVITLLKLLGDPQAMNYFKVWLRFPYHSICKKRRFSTQNIIKV